MAVLRLPAVPALAVVVAVSEQPGERTAEVVRASDIHYELALDQAPDPVAAVALVGEADVEAEDEKRAIIPHQWRRENRGATIAYHRARLAHVAGYHAVRLHWYLLLTCAFAVLGVFRLAGRAIRWAWVMEAHELRRLLSEGKDSEQWRKLHKDVQEDRKTRFTILACIAAALAVIVGLAWYYTSVFGVLAVAVIASPWLVHYGRPADKRIISAARVTPRYRLINADVVLRAYYAAKLGDPVKPDQQVTFGSTMQRDGEGSRVKVDLPFGKGLKDAVAARDEIASGLDVTTSQVYLHRDPTSARRHTLWVADRDPLAVPVGRTPLLACKPADIWKPAPIGLDERGQLVKLLLMWQSVLVGALPRQGKTWTARQLALFAALDPYVKLHVFDPTGKPDWRKFALVADSCAFGLTPTRDGLPPEIFLNTLEKLKDEVNRRYVRLSELQETHPAKVPEGKLTRDLARDLRMRMQVNVLFVDEVQEYLDLGPISLQIADLLVFLTKVAPAAGMPVILATQRPSGIGTGTTAQRFIALRDMCAVRFSLRTPDWRVSEMVLGAGALGEGLDSSKLLPEYKGVGILRGASDKSPTTRTFLANDEDAGKILLAARAIRERAGTLSGMALGEETPHAPSVLADVMTVLGEQPAAHWETLAEALAARFPDRHGDCTAESISAQCRAAGVPSVDVKSGGRSRMGCRREHVEAVLRGGAA